MSGLDLMMPFSVPMTAKAGERGLYIPLAFQNADVVGTPNTMDRRIQLPPGKCFIRATWDGPEALHVRFARMIGVNVVTGFIPVLDIPAGPAGVSRSTGVVELAMTTHGCLLADTKTDVSVSTAEFQYTCGVEVIPSGGPQAQ